MSLDEKIRAHAHCLYQQCLKPAVRWLSEYVNTLYYSNQLVAYALAAITIFGNNNAKPLEIAITVPILSACLMGIIAALKQAKPKKDSLLDKLCVGLRNFLFSAYSNWIVITLISILSSICLVMSCELLLIYYTGLAGSTLAVSSHVLLAVIGVCIILKFSELVAHLPLIRHLKQIIQKEEKSTEAIPDNQILDKSQESTRIYLHCFNYFISFSANSLTVIIALLAASGTLLSAPAAWGLLAGICILASLSCMLTYIKQRDTSDSLCVAPVSLPTDNTSEAVASRIMTIQGAENRTSMDSLGTLAQILYL
ncbi:MAG: hypothetical protein CMF52_05470 [Legionellales bacterium]|nr:hypothetical protein [Legionellales bacterium]